MCVMLSKCGIYLCKKRNFSKQRVSKFSDTFTLPISSIACAALFNHIQKAFTFIIPLIIKYIKTITHQIENFKSTYLREGEECRIMCFVLGRRNVHIRSLTSSLL